MSKRIKMVTGYGDQADENLYKIMKLCIEIGREQERKNYTPVTLPDGEVLYRNETQ